MPKKSKISFQKNAYETWILEFKKTAQSTDEYPGSFSLVVKEKHPSGFSKVIYHKTLTEDQFAQNSGILSFSTFNIRIENKKLIFGEVESECNLILDTEVEICFKEKIQLEGNLIIDANKVINERQIEAQGFLRICSTKLINHGKLLGGTIEIVPLLEKLEAESLDNRMGQICAKQDLTIRAASITNRGGMLSAERLKIQTLGQFDNRRGVVLAKNGIHLSLRENLNNEGGRVESEEGLVSIHSILGRILSRHYGSIQSQIGTVILEAPHILSDDTNILQGKELTKLTGEKKIIQESVLSGNEIQLKTEQLDLNAGIFAQKLASIFVGKKRLSIQKPVISSDRLSISGNDLDVQSRLLASQSIISVQGKLQYLENCFHIKQSLAVSLKEGFDLTIPIKISGSLSLGLASTAKNPINILSDISLGSKMRKISDLVIKVPNGLVRFGGEDNRYVTCCATGKVDIQARGFSMIHAKIVSQQDLSIVSKEDLSVGILTSQASLPSGLISGGNLKLSSEEGKINIAVADLNGHLELSLHSRLEVSNASGRIRTLGDCLIDSPLFRHRIAIQQLAGGLRSDIERGNAHQSYRTSGNSEFAIGDPASLMVGKKLITRGQTEMHGSQIHHNGFEGEAPKQTSFIPYTSWVDSHLCGHKKLRKARWYHNQHQSFGTPVLSIFSSGSELQLMSPSLEIAGIVFAPLLKLSSFSKGHIGWQRLDIRLPKPKDFQQSIALSSVMKPNPGYYLKESTGVFESVLASHIKPSHVPMTVLRPDGALVEQDPSIICQMPPELQAELIVQVLMSEFARGFLDALHTTPESIYHKLQKNAYEFFSQGQGNAGLNEAGRPIWTRNLQVPILVYRKLDVLGKIRLTPDIVFPSSWNTPNLRDWAGGLFSLSHISIEGAGRDHSTLTITSHLQSKGQIHFSNLKAVTQEKHLYHQETSCEETQETSKCLGLYRKKISHYRRVICDMPQAGNTVTASGVNYKNIEHLNFKGINMRVGEEGVKGEQIGILSEQPVLTQDYEIHQVVDRHLFGRRKATEMLIKQDIYPSSISSQGSVTLSANRSIFSSLQLASQKNITLSAQEHLELSASKTTIHHPTRTLTKGHIKQRISESSEQGLPVTLSALANVSCHSEGTLHSVGTQVYGKNVSTTAENHILQEPLVLNHWSLVKSRGAQGLTVFKAREEHQRQTGISPVMVAEEDIHIQSKRGDIILVAPSFYSGGLLSIAAPEGAVEIKPAIFHQDMNSRETSFALSFFGSESIQAIMRRDFFKASKALLREFPILSSLGDLMRSKDAGDKVGNSLKALYHFHHILDDFITTVNLKELLDKQWALNPNVRAGQSSASRQWTELALPWLQAQNILLKAQRLEASGLQVEAQNFHAEASEQILITAASQERSEHSHQQGVTLGLKKDGVLYGGIDFNRENSRAREYLHSHFDIAKQFSLTSEGEISMRGVYVKTLEAIVKAESFELETLQDCYQHNGFGVNLSSEMSASVSLSQQRKKWSSEQSGIEAQEKMLINVRKELKLLGAKLLVMGTKPLIAKLSSGEALKFYEYPLAEGLEAAYPDQPQPTNVRVWKKNESGTLEVLSEKRIDENAPVLELNFYPETESHTFLYPKPGLLRAANLMHQDILDSESSRQFKGSLDVSGLFTPGHWLKATGDFDYRRHKAAQINRATVSDDIEIFTGDSTVTVNRSSSQTRSYDDSHCHYRGMLPIGDPKKIAGRFMKLIEGRTLLKDKAKQYVKDIGDIPRSIAEAGKVLKPKL